MAITRVTMVIHVLIFSGFSLQGQTITQNVRGQVRDVAGKSSLPGANVFVINSDPLIGTTTDQQGNFELKGVPVGRHAIKVSYLGYKPVIRAEVLISSGKETQLIIDLEEDALEAQEVEIKATIDKDKPMNRLAMVSARSFTVEESRRYAGSADDPLRAVSAFAGVAASSDVASNEIVVRGNSPRGLLWRLEGIDIPNPNHYAYVGNSGGGVTMLSSQVLGNSDFFTAAFPAQYGNALSGVFDMKFKTGNSHKHEFAIQAGIQGLDLSAEGPFSRKNNSSYLFNYRYSILAFVQLIDPEMKNKIPQYQDLSFKLNFPTRKAGTFSLIGLGGISRSTGTALSDTNEWETLDNRTNSELNNNMGALGLIHTAALNRKVLIRSTLSATYSDVNSSYGLVNPDLVAEPKNNTKHEMIRLSAASSMDIRFSARHRNRSGVSYVNMQYNMDIWSTNPFSGKYEQVDKGKGNTDLFRVYTESEIDLTGKLRLGLGLHFQYLQVNRRSSVEPRAGLRYQISERHAVSLGFGKHSQSEDVGTYLTEQVPAGEYELQPNRSLDFSRAHHFVLGYDFLIRSDIRFKAEAYHQALYSIPVIQGSYYSLINSDGGNTNDPMVNEGTGRNTGLDLTLEKFLTRQYYFLFTVSVFDSKYKGGDGLERNTRYNSNYVINMLAGKEWTIRKKNLLGVNLKASYTGGGYYVPIDLEASILAHRRVLDEPRAFEACYPDFFYLDITVTYRTNHRKFSGIWAIQVKNVLNQKTEIGQVYNDFNQTIEPVRSMGILPFISYKIEF